MYNIDIMDYVNLGENTDYPSLLDITVEGKSYNCRVLHANSNCDLVTRKKTLKPIGHKHTFLHILLFTEGGNSFFYDDSPCPVERGDLILFGSNISHCFSPINKGKLKYSEITFVYEDDEKELAISFSELMSVITGIEVPEIDMPLRLKEKETETILQMMQSVIIHLKSATPLGLFHAHRNLSELFGYLLDNIYINKLDFSPPEEIPGRLWDARLEIEKNYNQKITLEELAEIACLNPDYFCRTFKKVFGISPIAYQQELRIKAAKNLLLSTSLRCKEIAKRTGFYDEYAFSRIFKKIVGVSPVRLRKKNTISTG